MEQAGKTNQVWMLLGAVAMAAGTGAKIEGVDNSSFGQLCDILEITAFGDEYKKRMAGLLDSSFSISGNYYPGDTTGQDILEANVSKQIYIGTMPQGVAVAGKQLPVIVQSFDVSTDVAGKQVFTCAFAPIGAPVALPIRS